MFGNKKRIKELEQKVEKLSEMLKVSWRLENRHNSYSPPTLFWEQYGANYLDVVRLLLEYLGLELVETPKKDREAILKKIKR